MPFLCRVAVFLICLLQVSALVGQPLAGSPRQDAIFARRGYIKVLIGNAGAAETLRGTAELKLEMPSGAVQVPAREVTISRSGSTLTASAAGKAVGSASRIAVSCGDRGIVTCSKGAYRGRIILEARTGTRLVNELLLDDWLKGVLPAEIGADSHPEALKAQAVAGRSEAIYRLLKPPHEAEGYDFCSSEHCQAYRGVSKETPECVSAAEETLGVVLIAEGDVVNGVYHNVCGGVTAAAEDVWDSKALAGLVPVYDCPRKGPVSLSSDSALEQFLKSAAEACYCDSSNPNYANYAKKYFRWTKTLSGSQIAKLAGTGRLRDIQVTERRPSGRVRKLTLVADSGSMTLDKELPIRRMFDLWSGLFVLDVQKTGGYVQQVTFIGGGNGHGVGLCQHGARELARRGGTFAQILKHYYPTTAIQKIYRP